MTLVNEVTDKMCKRTRWLTSHGQQYFFFHKVTVGTVAEYSLVIKPRAEILPIVFYCWISLFILSMWSVRHNIFVHQECECTCWRYSKKKSNKQNTVKPTIKVFTEITVSGYLLQRSLTGLPKLGKKRKKENRKNLH